MKRVIVAIGTDHRGYELKEFITKECAQINGTDITWMDMGADSEERVDYPVYAQRVVGAIKDKKAEHGLLLCAAGNGMAIAANRHKGIFAAVAWNKEIARLAKEDDNANILVIPADFIAREEVCAAIHAWVNATFKEGRYKKRLEMVDQSNK